MEPIISKLDYTQRLRLDFAAPNREQGILAALDYLEGRVKTIRSATIIPATMLVILAIAIAVVAWALR